MNKREFIQRSVAGALAIGATGKVPAAFAETTNGQNASLSKNIKRKLGKTGYEVFPVVYGGIISSRDGQAASNNYVAWALDRGVNYFDVAPSYGDAQEKLGISLKPFRKENYLACKTTQRTREGAEKEFEESLRLLHTDYFDLYQMHSITTPEDVDKAFGPNGVMEMIERKTTGAHPKSRILGSLSETGYTRHVDV